MNNRRKKDRSFKKNGIIHGNAIVTDDDLNRVKEITGGECPRRYCWWWHSLAFDWEANPSDGCTWLTARKLEHWKFKETPCCRCDTNSAIDLFEPRERFIEMDGIDPSEWKCFRSLNHQENLGANE